MSELCKWLHRLLEQIPLIRFPFDLNKLPENGVYFFYEDSELWGHGGKLKRIVRVGTHRQGNFRKRINQHYLLDDRKMNFDSNNPKPSDWSILRENIGRALLYRDNDKYLKIWSRSFTKIIEREKFAKNRNIRKEKNLEVVITKIIRDNFSFRLLIFEDEYSRIGSKGIENSLISLLASCELCVPTTNWLGNYSPDNRIRHSGLWQVQHVNGSFINSIDKQIILYVVSETKKWFKHVTK